MGRAAPLLEHLATRRGAAFAVLLAGLLVYYFVREALPGLPTAGDVALISLVLMPAVFALVWLALPAWRAEGLFAIGIAFALLAALCHAADFEIVSNFAKVGATTALAFWFLGYFETAAWVLLVAAIIPLVDAYSVFRGPTRHIVSERPEVFSALAFAFPVPGERAVLLRWRPPLEGSPLGYDVYRSESLPVPRTDPVNSKLIESDVEDGRVSLVDLDLSTHEDYYFVVEAVHRGGRRARSAPLRSPWPQRQIARGPPSRPEAPQDVSAETFSSTAKLGVPDLLFFALFLAATVRFRLRTGLTWAAMVGSFGLTMTLAVWRDIGGLPALPLLCVAFVAPNADLLWRTIPSRRRTTPEQPR